jgi:hypothetical protein
MILAAIFLGDSDIDPEDAIEEDSLRDSNSVIWYPLSPESLHTLLTLIDD